MRKYLLAVVLFGGSVTAAGAIDAQELAPCKPAAAKFCDRSDITASTSNLLRCGAMLATVSHKVGEPCRAVLRRYGQI